MRFPAAVHRLHSDARTKSLVCVPVTACTNTMDGFTKKFRTLPYHTCAMSLSGHVFIVLVQNKSISHDYIKLYENQI